MRSLSCGTVVYVVLAAVLIFCSPLAQSALAQKNLVIGFVVSESSLVSSSTQGTQMDGYFQNNSSLPIRVRSFAGEDQLYAWLVRYREIDIAWLSSDFLKNVPAGKLFTLASTQSHSSASPDGWFVARQGVDASLREKFSEVLFSMNETQDGRELLADLGISRIVDSSSWLQAELISKTNDDQDSKVLVPADAEPTAPDDKAQPAPAAAKADAQTIKTYRQDQNAAAAEKKRAPEAMSAGAEKDAAEITESKAEGSQEEQIELVADVLEYKSADDSYEAKGDVVLRRAGVELTASELLWQSATQDVSATGAVSLKDAGAVISGDSVQYNMSTGQGQIQEGRVFIQEGNFRLAGDTIEKSSQAEYLVRNGSFTTCDGEIPDWKFSAEKVDVTLGGYATARNVFFHIRDIPVFYTPYLAFPVKTERESGFLTPWFGYSNNKGTRASLAWYQVIDTNMDATLYLDYLSEVALGKGLEYRYALAGQNNGEALYYHASGFNDVPEMYYLKWQHRGRLPGDWWLTGDVEYADKQRFFDEFGEVAEDYNRDKTVSTVMLQKNWQKLDFVAHGRYIKDLEVEDNDSVLQTLPELSLNLARYRLWDSPVYLGWESYATRFSREVGEEGNRLYLKPSVAATFKPAALLEVTPEIALHGRFYDVDSGHDDELVPEFKLSLVTRLQKDFSFEHWGVERLNHIAETRLAYTYIPDEDQDDLPEFDLLDRIEQRNEVKLELVNRLIARTTDNDGARSYRDFLQFRLLQSYDIDEARNNTSGEDQPFSDVGIELDFWPTRNISLEAESLIPVYGSTRFRAVKVGADARDESGNAVKLHYYYKDEDFADLATDYVRFRLDTSLFKPVYLRFEERYDLRESRELERVVGMEYRFKCWSLLLTYRNREQDDGDDDHEVMINFALAGLGQNNGFGNVFAESGIR